MKQEYLETPKRYNASDVLKIAGVGEPPVDLDRVMSAFGISQDDSLDFDKLSLSGFARWSEDRKTANIWVNPLEPENRRRFTLAHELGHLFQHMLPNYQDVQRAEEFKDGPREFRRDGSVGKEEREANQFAAKLLMPAPMVKEESTKLKDAYRKPDGKIGMSRQRFIDELAQKFEVSSQAMEYRLKNLRIIA
ncbi:ImmA/IrrE family metallo-endopeptidase [Shimia sp. W99]